MHYKRPNFKEAPQKSKHIPKPINKRKTVEFKKKVFEFMENEQEKKSEEFNKTITIPSPKNKEMILFVDKFSWTPSNSLVDATIII
jgi:hypothetical protein